MAGKLAAERAAFFLQKLLEKRGQLEVEVGRSTVHGRDQEDDSNKDLGDQAMNAYNREFQFGLGNGDRQLLREVVFALRKLDEGEFGTCERCDNAIGERRLEALPFARYCIECQRRAETEARSEVA